MLKLRSIFVTSLLTGLVATSNFGCGGSSNGNTDTSDTNKTDVKADATDVPKETGGTGGATPDAKPDADAVDASEVKDTADTADVLKDAVDATDAGDAKEAGDGGEAGETITPVCPVTPVCVLNAKRCGPGGGAQTCVTAASGCPDWGTEVACGAHQTCGGAGVCTCTTVAGCTAAGTFCDANHAKATCAADAQGCFYLSVAAAACPTDTVCTGTLPSAACTCDNKCATVGNFCADAKTAATCSNDGNTPACRVISATTPCGAVKGCVAGECKCPAPGGTHENEGCTRGTDANICDGAHILTCVRDTDSSCDIWKVAPGGLCESDNGGGLTCGKGPSNSGAAACQCPVRTGTTVIVDPVSGSDLVSGVFPTGIQSPPQCRFGSITKGLATAGVTSVVAFHETVPVTFSSETFPLTIPTGVSVTTADATPTAANYVIAFDASANGAVNGIVLSGGSSLKGFTILNSSTNNVAPGLSCTAGAVIINTVVLDGNHALHGGGIAVRDTCTLTSTASIVKNINGVALNVQSSGVATITGGALTTSSTGIHVISGKVVTDGVAITENNSGVVLDLGAGPSIELTNGSISGGVNGDGAQILKGSMVATGTAISGNNGNGVFSASGTSVTLNNLTVDKNAANGLSIAGGAALHGVTVSNSGANGVASAGAGADVTIDQASVISTNGPAAATTTGNGISATDGKLTVTNAKITANKLNGVFLGGATTNISNVSIDLNKANGVDIASPGVVINIGTAGPKNTIITGNSLDGILARMSSKTASDSASLKIESASITTNTGNGIHFSASAGQVFAILRSSSVASNGGTGVIVESGGTPPGTNTTNTVFQDNDVTANGISGVTNGVGGILFSNSSTLSTFLGNRIHLNVGDEVGFFAPQALDPPRTTTVVWNIAAAGCDAASNPNFIYDHGAGNVGLRAPQPVGVPPVTVMIDARNVHWQVAPPSNIDDYSNTGGITVTPNCSAAP